jgi:hypothetical protein
LPGIIWLILILVGRAHPIMLPLVARCATDLLIGRPGRSSDDPERPCSLQKSDPPSTLTSAPVM